MENDNYKIDVLDYIKTLFKKSEDINQSKTIEDWNKLTYPEKIDEFRRLMSYYKKRWAGYRILYSIFKHLSLLSILISILLFWKLGIFYFLGITIGIFCVMWLSSLRCYRLYRLNMMEYRSYEFFIIYPEYLV